MSKAQIIEIHCSEAAYLWRLRDGAVRDRAYSLLRLAELDERIDAHLDGLVLAGKDGWSACAETLEDPTPGGVFAALFVAVSRRDGAALAHVCRDGAALPRVLEAASGSPELQRGAVAALAWLPLKQVTALLPYLFAAGGATQRQYLGLASCALHRHDPGDPVMHALASAGPLRARALRAVGELGRSDVSSELRARYESPEMDQRFWACWSGSLLGDSQAPDHLLAIVKGGGTHAQRACETAMRKLDLVLARRWLEWLVADGHPRVVLAGIAALGDPALVPWLLELMTLPELARLAAEAMHRITGVDFSKRPFRAKSPDGFPARPSDDPDEDDVRIDPDDGLPWPDRLAAEAYWRSARSGFEPGTRYLLGRPAADLAWLGSVLLNGSQPARAAAAEELCLRDRGPLFEVRARASRQLEACAHA